VLNSTNKACGTHKNADEYQPRNLYRSNFFLSGIKNLRVKAGIPSFFKIELKSESLFDKTIEQCLKAD